MFRKVQGWTALLVAGGTVAESHLLENGDGKGKTPLHGSQLVQSFTCKNEENWADIFGTMHKRRGTPRR